ncbi:MAG: response regulator [Methanobacterium sp.]|uniref:response regulator n=1 Tax=Methanobacterium sp. TaxID=2164 RepID=UPI003D656F60|nr:response regulator [Methanobacterium sp.]
MGNTQILVVEDERITAEDIKAALESVGYMVPEIVASGEEAIKKVEELQLDLILMDIQLEGEMDGIRAADKIKEKYDIPVIYLTAYSDNRTVQRAKITEPSGYILKEPFGFIRKPFEESELRTAIEITLYRHKIEKRLRDHEQWLNAILKSVNDAVIATDSKRQIKFMNPVAEDLTGWIQEDAIGESLENVFLIESEELDNFDEPLELVGSFNTIIIISKDGTKMPVDGSITHIKDEKGNIKGLVLVFRKNPFKIAI